MPYKTKYEWTTHNCSGFLPTETISPKYIIPCFPCKVPNFTFPDFWPCRFGRSIIAFIDLLLPSPFEIPPLFWWLQNPSHVACMGWLACCSFAWKREREFVSPGLPIKLIIHQTEQGTNSFNTLALWPFGSYISLLKYRKGGSSIAWNELYFGL